MILEVKKLNVAIYVDADACPVKPETLKVASRHKIEVYIVSNGGIRPSTNPTVKTIIVNAGPDAADNWIFKNVKKGDIVITSDIPLSSQAINIGANVISPYGEVLGTHNIGAKIATRNLMFELRSANPFQKEKGKEFRKTDRIRYVNALEKLIQTIKKSL